MLWGNTAYCVKLREDLSRYSNRIEAVCLIKCPFYHCVGSRRREMYSGHDRLCLSVCLSVPRRIPTLLCGNGCNLRNGRGAL